MKLCIRCQTENSSDYKYCKFCGAELPCVDRKPVFENASACDTESKPFENVPVTDEVSIYEMNAFVGKNCGQIVPTFVDLERKNKKISWCWPVFLLGIFCGFLGMAAWFFYRKMNKIGFIMLGCTLLLNITDLVLNFDAFVELYRGVFELLFTYADSAFVNPDFASAWLDNSMNQLISDLGANVIAFPSYINEYVGGFILPIIMGLFGLNLYKNHSLKEIAKIKRDYGETPQYIFRLSTIGGTSTARAVAAFIVTPIISLLIALIPMIVCFTGA